MLRNRGRPAASAASPFNPGLVGTLTELSAAWGRGRRQAWPSPAQLSPVWPWSLCAEEKPECRKGHLPVVFLVSVLWARTRLLCLMVSPEK